METWETYMGYKISYNEDRDIWYGTDEDWDTRKSQSLKQLKENIYKAWEPKKNFKKFQIYDKDYSKRYHIHTVTSIDYYDRSMRVTDSAWNKRKESMYTIIPVEWNEKIVEEIHLIRDEITKLETAIYGKESEFKTLKREDFKPTES